MHRNKLLDILEKIAPKELLAFQDYFQRNYPKQNALRALLSKLVAIHPDFGQTKEALDKLYLHLFSSNNTSKFRTNTFRKLQVPLEDFLILQKIRKDDVARKKVLAKIYKKQGLEVLYQKEQANLGKDLEKQKKKETWFWLKKLELAHEGYFNLFQDKSKCGPDDLNTALEQLNFFTTAAQLKYACELYARSNILNEPTPQIKGLEESKIFALKADSPFHKCFALVLELNQHQKTEDYFKAKEEIVLHIDQFQKEDQHQLLNSLFNHIAQKIKNGEQDFLEEQFELMALCIPREFFITNGHFNFYQFINIVDTASQLGKVDWTKNFIQASKQYLDPKVKEKVLELSKGLWLFADKKFQEVSQLMNTFRSGNIQFELRGRWLFLQANYELGEIDLYERHLENLEAFVRRRDTLHPQMQKGALAVVHFMKRLIKVNVNKEKLLKDLQQAKPIYRKSWLLKKVKALK